MSLTPLELQFIDWENIDYQQALIQQLELVQKVEAHRQQGYLVFCTHPPVVTLGRKTEPDDVTLWQGSTIEVSRGGRATYHGPSQLVIYPIMSISEIRKGRGINEIHGFLRDLENSIVETLKDYGVQAVGKSVKQKAADTSPTEETGVWVGDKKIASLGIGIKNWVTYHGAAINLDEDPLAFSGMRPCGFSPSVMTNLEIQTGQKINRTEFKKALLQRLLAVL